MKGKLNFKDMAGYKKWLAYGHMHVSGFGKTPQKISIAGKSHKVKHDINKRIKKGLKK